jgi:hypothetical protein
LWVFLTQPRTTLTNFEGGGSESSDENQPPSIADNVDQPLPENSINGLNQQDNVDQPCPENSINGLNQQDNVDQPFPENSINGLNQQDNVDQPFPENSINDLNQGSFNHDTSRLSGQPTYSTSLVNQSKLDKEGIIKQARMREASQEEFKDGENQLNSGTKSNDIDPSRYDNYLDPGQMIQEFQDTHQGQTVFPSAVTDLRNSMLQMYPGHAGPINNFFSQVNCNTILKDSNNVREMQAEINRRIEEDSLRCQPEEKVPDSNSDHNSIYDHLEPCNFLPTPADNSGPINKSRDKVAKYFDRASEQSDYNFSNLSNPRGVIHNKDDKPVISNGTVTLDGPDLDKIVKEVEEDAQTSLRNLHDNEQNPGSSLITPDDRSKPKDLDSSVYNNTPLTDLTDYSNNPVNPKQDLFHSDRLDKKNLENQPGFRGTHDQIEGIARGMKVPDGSVTPTLNPNAHAEYIAQRIDNLSYHWTTMTPNIRQVGRLVDLMSWDINIHRR